MPITITPPPPLGAFGPGIPLTLQSSFIGPLSSSAVWVLQFAMDSEGSQEVYKQGFFVPTNPVTILPWTAEGGSQEIGQFMPQDSRVEGAAHPFALVVLNDPAGTPVDSGTLQAPWDQNAGAGWLSIVNRSEGGSLTPTQATQLEDIHQATLPVLTQDGMGVNDLTGPDGLPSLTVALPSPVFGIIVRLTAIPDTLVPIQGDADYWRQTLARVSIFRGGDLWQRYPVHTQNRMFMLPGNELASGIAAIPSGAWLLSMSLQLSTLPGVLAQVLTMTLP